MPRGIVLTIGLSLAIVDVPSAQPASAPATGVVVETIGPPWSGAAQAGLRAGDVITHWAPPGSSSAGERAVTSVADWAEAEAEHALRLEGLRVTMVREGRAQAADLRGGAWLLGVVPVLSGAVADELLRAQELTGRGERAQAAAVWRDLAVQTENDSDRSLTVWFRLRAGAAELTGRNAAAAQTTYGLARAAAAERRLTLLEREALDGLARAHQAAQQIDAARQARTDMVALLERERPASPTLVRALNGLARFQRDFGPLLESGVTDRRALDLARAICPGSIAEVSSLGGLSLTERRTGNLAMAERLLDEAAAILERFPPSHPDRMANAANRGILVVQQNRLAEGERWLMQAESLDRARGTPPDAVALTHHGNLGIVATQRGDLARAEGYFRSNLEAVQRSAGDSLDVIRSSMNLAVLASERGDYDRALAVFESARALAARVAPNSTMLADALGNLGTARVRTGDAAGSTAAYEEALRIRLEVTPDDESIAAILYSLAANAERRGDLTAAAAFLTRARAQVDRVAPAGLTAGRTLHVAARIALARGDTAEARRLQEDGLRVVRTVAPGSRLEVAALATLARIDVRDGRLTEAASRYAEAIDALGFQIRRLGAALDVEAAYVDDADVQRPYIDVLIALGRDTDAFEAMERFRARSVLDRLAARDLTFGRSGEAADLTREQRRLARDYDATLGALARLAAAAISEKARPLQDRLREIRASQALAASNLRRVDAALADALDPPPLTLAELQRTLPAGTLALVYHLGAERPAIFAIARDRFRVAPMPVSGADVGRRVDAWRRLVDRGRTERDPSPALDDASRALYRALIEPIEAEARSADRLIVVPDGALHGLSFAALLRPVAGSARREYVAEWKLTSVAPSLTVLTHLSSRARAATARTAVVVGGVEFGDGTVATSDPGDRAVRQGVVGALMPLPGSRREAEGVAAQLAPRATLLVGGAATEEAVKGLPRNTSILHLATHGVTNDRAPLDSALVLSAGPGSAGDNGLLQAWEIFDHVRVDADLVVLSACDTGLGRAFAGEGLLGLTRAFQFAGARAVVASLWKAPDEATATLMEAFYRELAGNGATPDAALAGAMRAMLSRPETRHPYFWAAFVIDGDAGRPR